MKRESFRASRGRGKLNYFGERYNKSSSFSNDFNETSKLPRFAREGGGGLNLDKD